MRDFHRSHEVVSDLRFASLVAESPFPAQVAQHEESAWRSSRIARNPPWSFRRLSGPFCGYRLPSRVLVFASLVGMTACLSSGGAKVMRAEAEAARKIKVVTEVSYSCFATSALSHLNRGDVALALSVTDGCEGTHILYSHDGVSSTTMELDPHRTLSTAGCTSQSMSWKEAFDIILSGEFAEPIDYGVYPSQKLMVVRRSHGRLEVFSLNPVSAWALPLVSDEWAHGKKAEFLCLLRAVSESIPSHPDRRFM